MAVEQQKRQAAEMIPVQMRDDNGVKVFELEFQRLPAEQSGGAEFNGDDAPAALDPEAGVVAPA